MYLIRKDINLQNLNEDDFVDDPLVIDKANLNNTVNSGDQGKADSWAK